MRYTDRLSGLWNISRTTEKHLAHAGVLSLFQRRKSVSRSRHEFASLGMRCPWRAGRRGAFLSKASPAVLSRKARRNSSSIMRRQYAEPARLSKAGVADSEVSAQEILAPTAAERSRPIRTNLAGPMVAPNSILGIRLRLQPLKLAAVNLSGRRRPGIDVRLGYGSDRPLERKGRADLRFLQWV